MIKHVIGDMFASDANVFVHQVNCKGVMGSGVAKQVRELFPDTYSEYVSVCTCFKGKSHMLLGYALTMVEQHNGENVHVINLFAQDSYGNNGKCYTNYDAFRRSIQLFKSHIPSIQEETNFHMKIAMPYRIGCDRGGGDWNIVYGIIEEELGDFDVTLYELQRYK